MSDLGKMTDIIWLKLCELILYDSYHMTHIRWLMLCDTSCYLTHHITVNMTYFIWGFTKSLLYSQYYTGQLKIWMVDYLNVLSRSLKSEHSWTTTSQRIFTVCFCRMTEITQNEIRLKRCVISTTPGQIDIFCDEFQPIDISWKVGWKNFKIKKKIIWKNSVH